MENTDKKLIIRPRRAALGKTAVVSVRLSEDMIKRLDAITMETGHSRNELIQLCVEFGLDNLEIKNDLLSNLTKNSTIRGGCIWSCSRPLLCYYSVFKIL